MGIGTQKQIARLRRGCIAEWHLFESGRPILQSVYRRLTRWLAERGTRAYLKLATGAAAITVGMFTLLIV